MADGIAVRVRPPGPLSLIRRNARMARLTAAVLVSSAGDPLSLTVSLVLLYGATRSPIAIAAAYLAQMIGVLAVGGLFGAAADRADRRRMIVRLEMTRWVVVACLPLLTLLSVFTLYPVLMVLGAIESLVEPARQAAVPELVEPDEVGPANSLVLTAQSLAQAVGFAVAGLALVHLTNPRPLYFIDAFTFAAAALLVMTLGSMGGGVKTARLRGGLRRAWRVPGAPSLLLVAGATVFFVGMLNPSLLPLAYSVSPEGPTAYSLIQVFLVSGLLVGSLAAGRIVSSWRLVALAASLWLFGIAVFVVGLSSSLAMIALAISIAGAGNAVYAVTNASALMQVATNFNRGTVMASRFTVVIVTSALGLGVGAVVSTLLGPKNAFLFIGTGVVVLAGLYSTFLATRRTAG